MNTGYKVFKTLLKVSTDNSPLDANNELCSVSGLPQDSKNNYISDADYIAPFQDLLFCPVDQTVVSPGRTIRSFAADPCTAAVIELFYDSSSDLFYTTDQGSDLYSGYFFEYRGPTGAGVSDYEWTQFTYVNGALESSYPTYSQCQPI
jgi:hypothetical protein